MNPETFIRTLIENCFSPFMGVPCSIFKDLIAYIENAEDIQYYLSSSEGEAMGMAGGFALAGRLPVVLMQNDGYGNAVNPLSSLQMLYKLPCLLLISWRAEPGKKDAPQHYVMGQSIEKLLSVFKIPCTVVENETGMLQEAVKTAREYAGQYSLPYAFLIRKGYFGSTGEQECKKPDTRETRAPYLKSLKSLIDKKDVIIGATGYTGRELYSLFDHKGKFYMMGSMGCASSIGMALAEEKRKRRIFILDGDGALIMKMGTLTTIGYYKPENLIHICFDNNQYESTGGQRTASKNVDFCTIAHSCGYNSVKKVETLKDFEDIIKMTSQINGPYFIHVIIKPGTIDDLPRPADTPESMKESFKEFLSNN